MRVNRFLVGLCVIALGVVIDVSFHAWGSAGSSIAVLVALALFFDISSIVAYELLGVLILNWQNTLTPELVIYLLLPLTIVLIRKRLPFRSSVAAASLGFGSVFVLHAIPNIGFITPFFPQMLAASIIGSVLAGCVFGMFHWMYRA